LRQLCKEASLRKDTKFLARASQKIKNLDLTTLNVLLRSFTTFFHLVNKAEQLEIVRINTEREIKAKKRSPRSESIAEAVYQLKQNGHSLQNILENLHKLDIQPTFTAHPTEARRLGLL